MGLIEGTYCKRWKIAAIKINEPLIPMYSHEGSPTSRRCQTWKSVDISGKVFGRGQDNSAIEQKLDPVGHDLSHNEEGAQVPEGVRRVEVERIEGQRREQKQMEQGRNCLQQVSRHGAGAPNPGAHLPSFLPFFLLNLKSLLGLGS